MLARVRVIGADNTNHKAMLGTFRIMPEADWRDHTVLDRHTIGASNRKQAISAAIASVIVLLRDIHIDEDHPHHWHMSISWRLL
jgi:hypothetical protein